MRIVTTDRKIMSNEHFFSYFSVPVQTIVFFFFCPPAYTRVLIIPMNISYYVVGPPVS